MECTNVQEQLSAFIDGEADAASEPMLFAHLTECLGCRDFFRDAQAMHAEVHRARPLRAPANLDRRVLGTEASHLLARRMPRESFLRAIRARVSVPMPVAAAVIILLTATLAFLFRGPGRGLFVSPAPIREVVYVMTLPAVEVEATVPAAHSAIH